MSSALAEILLRGGSQGRRARCFGEMDLITNPPLASGSSRQPACITAAEMSASTSGPFSVESLATLRRAGRTFLRGSRNAVFDVGRVCPFTPRGARSRCVAGRGGHEAGWGIRAVGATAQRVWEGWRSVVPNPRCSCRPLPPGGLVARPVRVVYRSDHRAQWARAAAAER